MPVWLKFEAILALTALKAGGRTDSGLHAGIKDDREPIDPLNISWEGIARSFMGSGYVCEAGDDTIIVDVW